MAPHYNSYSFHTFINWLLFRPLYNDHFLLSPRWPLITVILYQVTLVTLVTQVISYGFQTSLQFNPLNPYFADEVEIKFDEKKAWLVNNEYNTQPLVAHGNGPSKVCTNKNTNYRYNFPSSYPSKILTQLVKTVMIWLVWVCGKESWCWFALFKSDLCVEMGSRKCTSQVKVKVRVQVTMLGKYARLLKCLLALIQCKIEF